MKQDGHLFALRPPPGAIAEMRPLRDAQGGAGTAIRDEHLHVTLFWLGYDPPDVTALVGAARAAADGIVARPFRVLFDQLVGGPDSLLLKSGEPLPHVHTFQRQLATALASHGLRAPRSWRFDPHVTLRRGPGLGGVRTVDPIAWTATEYVLIHSEIGHTRHTTLGTWPLVA